MERTRIKRFKRVVAVESEKEQQLLGDRWETNETANRHLAENGKLLQKLQSTPATATAVLSEWCELAAGTTEELKVVKAEIVQQSGRREAARVEMDAHTAKVAGLKQQLAAENAKLLQLAAKHGELHDELLRVNSQRAVGATVSGDLKSFAEACERPAKRA